MATIYWRPGGSVWTPGARAYLNWREKGEQFRRSLGELNPHQAEEIRAAKEAELRHGVKIIQTESILLRDYLSTYTRLYLATHPTTRPQFLSEIKRINSSFGHVPVEKLQPRLVQEWIAERLNDGANPATVRKEVGRLKAALVYGVENKYFAVNTLVNLKPPVSARSVAVKFYTLEEMGALYQANPKRASLWRLIANTGLRRGEAMRASRDQVINRRLMVESNPDATGKGRNKSGRLREIPLNDQACAAIEVLPHRFVSCAHADTLTEWFEKDAKVAGIKGSLHQLRHTFAAHLAMSGVSLRRIQLLMGHSDYATTEIYAHLLPSNHADTVALLKL
jgi:integrase